MPYLTRAGASLYYDSAGHGPAIVFSHGWACSGRLWSGQVAALEDRFTVVTWDALGHDRSDSPPDVERYAIDESLHDLDAVLDATGVTAAVLVGHSMGGLSSVRYALWRPERVAGLVLVGAGAGSAARTPETRSQWNAMVDGAAADLERHGLRPPPGTFVRSILDAPEPSLARHRSAEGLARSARGTLTYTDSSVLDALPSLRPPLLLVVGEQDADWIRASVEEAAAMVPGARVMEVAGAGHAVRVQRPDILNAAVTDFAGQVIAASRGGR